MVETSITNPEDPESKAESRNSLRSPEGKQKSAHIFGRAVNRLLSKEKPVTPEEVVAALDTLEASINPAVEAIKQSAPADHILDFGTDTFVHAMAPDKRLVVREGVVPHASRYKQSGQKGPVTIPDDAPRGREVAVIRSYHEEPPLKDLPMMRRATQLVFMEDGRVLYYETPIGDQRAEWQDMRTLSPRDALSIVQATAAGIEDHRRNP